MTDTASEWMTAGEAAAYLGVSKVRMAKLIAEGVLPVERGQLDARVKLVRRADVERIAGQPRGRAPKGDAVAVA